MTTFSESFESINDITRKQSGLMKSKDGVLFRDLNKNGKLDLYEDPRQPIEARVENLLGQMTLEEKAGTLFINGSVVNADGSIEENPETPGFGGVAAVQIADHKMNHFNLWQIPGVNAVATWHNNLQRFAEVTRLGIPITIASDPRNHFHPQHFFDGRQRVLPVVRDPGLWCAG
jgi:beta-glucosidase